jgi:hypothetical protein
LRDFQHQLAASFQVLNQLETKRSFFCQAPLSAKRAHLSLDMRLVMQNDIQQGTMHFEAAAVVVNETQFSKFIHEETDAGPCRADHLCKCLLTDFRANRFSGSRDDRRAIARRVPVEAIARAVGLGLKARSNLSGRNLSTAG